MDNQFWIGLLQIIWIDLLLSGDNAVVIALACRGLPEKQRKMGVLLGAGAAVGLRIIFALIITYLLAIPFLKLVGGLLLLWIAAKLAIGEEEGGHGEIAAASHGNVWLFVFGLALTIPLIIFGSALILGIIERFPLFVWAGAALLGWIAGDMLLNDPFVLKQLQAFNPALVVQDLVNPAVGWKAAPLPHYIAAVSGAVLVVAIGLIVRRRRTEASAAH